MSSVAVDRPVRRLSDWESDRLEQLAAEYGTPLYVTDLDRVQANYRRIVEAFGDARVMYAAKAHTGRAVLEAILEVGGSIECAAQGELRRAIAAGADPNSLQYTAVNPPAGDLDYAVELASDAPGFTVTAGATDTFDRLAERGYDGRVAVRINPGIGTGHHEKVATGADAKFGIPSEDVRDVATDVRTRFNLVGLHAHVGSGVLGNDIDDHARALARLGDCAREVGDLEFIDIGGGFGVPYRESEDPLHLPTVVERIREAIGSIDAELAVEPGRYVVADASVIVTRVNTVKETPTDTVVGVDASLATLIRPAMFDSYHPMLNLSGKNRPEIPVAVGGPCCTSADVFCTDRPLAEPKRGDLLTIGNAGAYGYELANQFHSQPRPAEVVLDDGNHRIARRRETYADLTRLEE